MSGQETVKDNMKRGRYDELKGILVAQRTGGLRICGVEAANDFADALPFGSKSFSGHGERSRKGRACLFFAWTAEKVGR